MALKIRPPGQETAGSASMTGGASLAVTLYRTAFAWQAENRPSAHTLSASPLGDICGEGGIRSPPPRCWKWLVTAAGDAFIGKTLAKGWKGAGSLLGEKRVKLRRWSEVISSIAVNTAAATWQSGRLSPLGAAVVWAPAAADRHRVPEEAIVLEMRVAMYTMRASHPPIRLPRQLGMRR